MLAGEYDIMLHHMTSQYYSAQNVKKWEAEMQTLRNNNAMLKTALEESTQHVSEWKKQLQKYKEECDQLKKKVLTINVHTLLLTVARLSS